LHDAFVVPDAIRRALANNAGLVLLIDDVVDTGWTMTLAARALRRAGVVDVLPFALATVGRRD
jgi:ATP-dependent DNA helicase RecQ